MRFVDTNVFAVLARKAPEEKDKAQIALEILQAEDLGLSVQVLQECYLQATRESKSDRIDHGQAASLVEAYLRFPVQETTVALMRAAMAAKNRFGISYWDAVVIESGAPYLAGPC